MRRLRASAFCGGTCIITNQSRPSILTTLPSAPPSTSARRTSSSEYGVRRTISDSDMDAPFGRAIQISRKTRRWLRRRLICRQFAACRGVRLKGSVSTRRPKRTTPHRHPTSSPPGEGGRRPTSSPPRPLRASPRSLSRERLPQASALVASFGIHQDQGHAKRCAALSHHSNE